MPDSPLGQFGASVTDADELRANWHAAEQELHRVKGERDRLRRFAAFYQSEQQLVGSDRLYHALAVFDSRDGSILADIARSAREGYERSAMGEPGAWHEFESVLASYNAGERY